MVLRARVGDDKAVVKQLVLRTLPPVLVVNLNRRALDGSKLQTPVRLRHSLHHAAEHHARTAF